MTVIANAQTSVAAVIGTALSSSFSWSLGAMSSYAIHLQVPPVLFVVKPEVSSILDRPKSVILASFLSFTRILVWNQIDVRNTRLGKQ